MTTPKPSRPSAITLLLPVVVMTVIGGLFWWRRWSAPPSVPPIPAKPAAVAVAPPLPAVPPSKTRSPLRWGLYLGTALLAAGILLVLQDQQPELASYLFLLLLAGTGLYLLERGLRKLWALGRAERQALVLKVRWFFRRFAGIIALVAVSAAVLAALWAAFALRDVRTFAPLLTQALYLFAVVLFTIALSMAAKAGQSYVTGWRLQITLQPSAPPSFSAARSLRGFTTAGLGILLLFLAAESSGQLLKSSLLRPHHVLQLLFLLAGILLLVLGLGGRVHLPVLTRRERLLLLLLLAAAFLLRAVALNEVIHRLVDEANFIDAIPRLWAKPDTPILYPFSDLTAFTWLYTLLQSAVSNLIGSGLPALRLPSAIFGTLGVAALYFFARTLFHDKGLAFIAAAVLATFPAHMHFSRLGLNNIADPFFGTLALAFLMRGFQSQRRSDFVVAGALLGLTQYFYEGGRLLFPPLFVVAFIIAWFSIGCRRAAFYNGLYALLVAGLVAAPVYYTLAAHQYPLTPRLTSESYQTHLLAQFIQAGGLGRYGWLNERAADPFLLYTTHPDQSWFYGGTESIVILALVPALLLGLAIALCKLRSVGVWVLLVWVGAATLGNMFLRESLWIPRYVVVFPALALLIALGIWVTLRLWLPPAVAPRSVYRLAVVLTLAAALVQTVFYFRDQAPAFMRQFQQDEDWNDAFFRMVDLPDGTRVHFIMDEPVWSINVQAFLGYYRLNMLIDTQMPFELTPKRLQMLSAHSSMQHVFFLNPTRHALVNRIKQCFDLQTPEFSPFDVPARSQLVLIRAAAVPARDCAFPLAQQLQHPNLTAILP